MIALDPQVPRRLLSAARHAVPPRPRRLRRVRAGRRAPDRERHARPRRQRHDVEPTTLERDERNRLVDTAIAVAKGRIPVVAQTGAHSHAETVALTDHAQKAGADAIMVLTPFFIRAPQRGVVAYFEDVAKRTDKPLLMYHIPGRSAFKVELDTLARLCDAIPHFVGIKHAADDHGFVTQMIAKLGRTSASSSGSRSSRSR
jgi:dihydrodipicolinate synthase/N-acetylneuraminate lyase